MIHSVPTSSTVKHGGWQGWKQVHADSTEKKTDFEVKKKKVDLSDQDCISFLYL